MSTIKFPLDEFQRWYWYEKYKFETSRGAWMNEDNPQKFKHDLVKEAFMAGCRWTASETLDTLAAYATAVEGLTPQQMTLAEMFDRTAENLEVYYNQVIGNELN